MVSSPLPAAALPVPRRPPVLVSSASPPRTALIREVISSLTVLTPKERNTLRTLMVWMPCPHTMFRQLCCHHRRRGGRGGDGIDVQRRPYVPSSLPPRHPPASVSPALPPRTMLMREVIITVLPMLRDRVPIPPSPRRLTSGRVCYYLLHMCTFSEHLCERVCVRRSRVLIRATPAHSTLREDGRLLDVCVSASPAHPFMCLACSSARLHSVSCVAPPSSPLYSVVVLIVVVVVIQMPHPLTDPSLGVAAPQSQYPPSIPIIKVFRFDEYDTPRAETR